MGAIASQITSVTIVYSTVYSSADQRKHQCSASLAFVRGFHRWPVNSPHKWPVTLKMFPFDDVIMGKGALAWDMYLSPHISRSFRDNSGPRLTYWLNRHYFSGCLRDIFLCLKWNDFERWLQNAYVLRHNHFYWQFGRQVKYTQILITFWVCSQRAIISRFKSLWPSDTIWRLGQNRPR